MKTVSFSENWTVYIVPTFCESRVWWRKYEEDTQDYKDYKDYSDRIAPSGETKLSETCSGSQVGLHDLPL